MQNCGHHTSQALRTRTSIAAGAERTARRVGPALLLALLAIGAFSACSVAERPAWERAAVGQPAAAASAREAKDAPPAAARPPVERAPLPPLAGQPAASQHRSSAGSVIASAPPPAAPTGGSGQVVAAATPAGVPRPAAAPAIDPAWTGYDVLIARHEDTLLDLAVQHGLGFLELAVANPGVDPWLPGEGTTVILPKTHLLPDAPQRGIVINLPEQRLFFFQNGKLVRSYPIGIGRDGHATPTGSTTVVRKAMNPTWYPTPSTRADDPELPTVFPPGPDNPLGTRAIYLGWPSYLIHGTNKEYGIGRRASRGCIRMYDRDVQTLYEKTPIGTPVTVVDQPIKVGFIGEDLYVEASPTVAQVRQREETGKFEPVEAEGARELAMTRAGPLVDRIDWAVFDRAVKERRGITTRITRPVGLGLPAIATSPPASPLLTAGAAKSGAALATGKAEAGRAAPVSLPASSPALRQSAAPQPTLPSGAAAARPPRPTAPVRPAVPSVQARPAEAGATVDDHPDDLVKWLRGRLSGSTP